MLVTVLIYCAVGAVAGLLAGLFGIGGGLVIVPMLNFAFGWEGVAPEHLMHLALGTSMSSICFTALSSLRAHHLRGAVDWSIVRRITAGVVIGTFGGSYLAAMLSTVFLKVFFVVFLFYVATHMLLGGSPKPTRKMPRLPATSAAGGVIGIVSSLVGIGGGTLSVPYMVWHNVALHRAVGTSAAIGFPIALAGSVGYLIHGVGVTGRPSLAVGYVYLPALAGIVIVSVLTAPLGVRLAHSLPVDKLRKWFAVLLVAVGVRMLVGALWP